MGCGSSAALSSDSKVQSITLHTKDAGSQTNVTVLIPSTSNARTEAHDARKELITQHRSEALARAKEISNSKSGYTTATYTGSGLSTPRSAYSRTHKLRGSNAGSLSDCDLRSQSEVLNCEMDGSRTNLSTRSSNVRKTQVSFRNEEYNRLATANKKRRKSYINRTKTPMNKIIRQSRKISAAGSNHSESSGSNSINKQADTGYEGSVSSGPSTTALLNGTRKSTATSDYSSPDGGIEIIQTVSNEMNPGRLSVVVSVDEQSFVHDNTHEYQATEESQNLSIIHGLSNNSSFEGHRRETQANHSRGNISPQSDLNKLQIVNESDKSVHSSLDDVNSPNNHVIATQSDNGNANTIDNNDSANHNIKVDAPQSPDNESENGDEAKEIKDTVNSTVMVVTDSPVLTTSDSTTSVKKVTTLTNEFSSNTELTAVE